jgi:peptide/nickel transport system substrate-binding protein
MEKKEFHPYLPELVEQLHQGKVTRREFIRYAALLGMSVGVASQIAGLGRPKWAFAAPIKRGGTLRVSDSIQKITHASAANWTYVGNITTQVAETLTFTDENNITHPLLLRNWEVSKDLKTWTLNLRQRITFNNGDEFTADDVVFTMKEFLKKEAGSSLLALIGRFLSPSGIEKVSKYQVKLHLDRPEIALPEHLYHYNAVMLNHRTFEGDFIKVPHGTGPFTLETYRPREICVMKRRNDYWHKGDDGKALPYVDGIEFIDVGEEMAPRVNALKAGEADMLDMAYGSAVDAYLAVKDDPRVDIQPVVTANVAILRMRCDQKPWTDNRVRMALKLCQNREKILQTAYFGQGLPGHDTHVFPKHPEYCPKPIPKYDPQKAKELLREAGYPDGIDVTMTVGSGWGDAVRYAEVLKEDAAPAGFRITIQLVPNVQYSQLWNKVNLGITHWTHRPLGTLVISYAYGVDDKGKPGSNNETMWVDEEFLKLVNEACGILDVEARRKIFCKLEDIQMSRGSIGIAYWKNVWSMSTKRLKNLKAHPQMRLLLKDLWLD